MLKIPLVLAVLAAFFVWDGRPVIYYPYLMEKGVAGEGEILEVWETGNLENEKPQVGVRLRVNPQDGQPFDAKTYCVLSSLAASDFRPGNILPVRYDPQDPGHIAIVSDYCTEMNWKLWILMPLSVGIIIWNGWPLVRQQTETETAPDVLSGKKAVASRQANMLRRIILSTILAVIVMAVGFVYMIVSDSSGDAEPAVGMILIGFFVSALFMLKFFLPIFRRQALLKKGVLARARLVRYWDTGTTINDDPQVGMQVQVRSPQGEDYPVEFKTLVARLEISRLQPGANLQVVVDPQDPQQVEFVAFEETDAPPDGGKAAETGASAEDAAAIRLAELEELHNRLMIGDSDYRRRRNELLGKE